MLSLLLMTSCGQSNSNDTYPRYSLEKISYVPDSLKMKHRTWIQETVRAASNQVSAGDYEDVGQTIKQTKWIADDLFQVEIIGLRKEVNEDYYDDILIKPEELTPSEVKVFNKLIN
jgi:enolase